MNRQTRKELKTDKFAQEVGDTFSFLNEHRSESVRYGLIGLAVIVLGAGYFFYSRHEAAAREDALAAAMRIDNAIIGQADTLTNKAFPTQEAKDQARTKAFSDLASKYHGTSEGSIGAMYMGADQADKGNYAAAEKIYKDAVDAAPKVYAQAAEISLAQLYAAEGKTDEAEKLLRYRIDHPAELVSADAATLDLADILSTTKPQEALKLAEPLVKSERVNISKEALNLVSRINMTGRNN